jgi:hypothetical protein
MAKGRCRLKNNHEAHEGHEEFRKFIFNFCFVPFRTFVVNILFIDGDVADLAS